MSTIRTKLSWNKACDKNKNNNNKKKKKMNKSQFCYLPVSYVGGIYYTCAGHIATCTVANAQVPQVQAFIKAKV